MAVQHPQSSSKKQPILNTFKGTFHQHWGNSNCAIPLICEKVGYVFYAPHKNDVKEVYAVLVYAFQGCKPKVSLIHDNNEELEQFSSLFAPKLCGDMWEINLPLMDLPCGLTVMQIELPEQHQEKVTLSIYIRKTTEEPKEWAEIILPDLKTCEHLTVYSNLYLEQIELAQILFTFGISRHLGCSVDKKRLDLTHEEKESWKSNVQLTGRNLVPDQIFKNYLKMLKLFITEPQIGKLWLER